MEGDIYDNIKKRIASFLVFLAMFIVGIYLMLKNSKKVTENGVEKNVRAENIRAVAIPLIIFGVVGVIATALLR